MLKQEEQTRKKFNTLKKYYDETWDPKYHTLHVGFFGNEAKTLFKAYEDATLNLIKKLNETSKITKGSIVLDIGCGTGRTLIYICEKYGCKGVGVDISDEMIKDAKKYLTEVNKNLKNKKLNIKFIRGSGSKLLNIFKKGEKFTHIISEDAIFLVVNKKSLFKNLYRLLIPGGALAIADFLSERPKKELTEKEENLIYKLVNWTEGLSFDIYQDILKSVGFQNIQAEKRDNDMIKTYSILAKNLRKYVGSEDKTYKELQDRYENIVSAVKTGKMSWGLFFAKKPRKKQVLLAGTNKKSIGRFIAKTLHNKLGWEVWLYGLHTKTIDKKYWHERKCDISSEKEIEKILSEIPDLDLAIMLADTGTGHYALEELTEKGIKGCINAKLVGTLLLNKALMKKYLNRNKPIKLVWCAGSPSRKPKHLIIYSMVNSGLAAYIDEINEHYKDVFEAYYIPTTLISPSTIGDDYICKYGEKTKKIAEHPQTILDKVLMIINDKIPPGMVETQKETL
jgi:cyclopropane fatty-acyl-phospholipid synthase-like methyltransferase